MTVQLASSASKLVSTIVLSIVFVVSWRDFAFAQGASGSGAVYGVAVGSENVTIFAVPLGISLLVHVRNVGAEEVSVRIKPMCAEDVVCGREIAVRVEAVERSGDASRDRIIPLTSAAQFFTWTITER